MEKTAYMRRERLMEAGESERINKIVTFIQIVANTRRPFSLRLVVWMLVSVDHIPM